MTSLGGKEAIDRSDILYYVKATDQPLVKAFSEWTLETHKRTIKALEDIEALKQQMRKRIREAESEREVKKVKFRHKMASCQLEVESGDSSDPLSSLSDEEQERQIQSTLKEEIKQDKEFQELTSALRKRGRHLERKLRPYGDSKQIRDPSEDLGFHK